MATHNLAALDQVKVSVEPYLEGDEITAYTGPRWFIAFCTANSCHFIGKPRASEKAALRDCQDHLDLIRRGAPPSSIEFPQRRALPGADSQCHVA